VEKDLWTWGGIYFGYRESDDLWTYDGQHIGKFIGNEIYDRYGHYLGELMNEDRLIKNRVKQNWRNNMFTPYGRRGSRVRYVNYVGYVMYAGYEDFPGPENFKLSKCD
jgi:hypothetical protein